MKYGIFGFLAVFLLGFPAAMACPSYMVVTCEARKAPEAPKKATGWQTNRVRTYNADGSLDRNLTVETFDYGYTGWRKQRVRVYEADGKLIFNDTVEVK